MTIKKPMKVTKPLAPVENVTDEVSAIPESVNLEAPAQNGAKASSGVATTIAVVAGLVALAIAGILTFVIYQHWEFLKFS